MAKLKAHAHPLIAETAHEMAHALYETLMSDNWWYDRWKEQNPGLSSVQLETLFVRRNVEKLLPQARATLAQMLATGISEDLKEQIYEALVMDKTLVAKRANPSEVIGRV